MFIDLDFFKYINDQYGHGVGDKALIRLGKTLTQCVRGEDVVARFGGDELAVIATVADYQALRVLVGRIRKLIAEIAIDVDSYIVEMTVSIGVAVVDPKTYPEPSDVIKVADNALYEVKRKGRDGCILIDAEVGEYVDLAS